MSEALHTRLIAAKGLDPRNRNAVSRAVVAHRAWSVSGEMIAYFRMLGRSQGCFAVADSSLPEIMTGLGPGRLIYADNISRAA